MGRVLMDWGRLVRWRWTEAARRAGRGRGAPVLTAGTGGTGVNRKLPHLGNGTGVNRQLPHLGDGGTGVNRKLEWLKEWFSNCKPRWKAACLLRRLEPHHVARNHDPQRYRRRPSRSSLQPHGCRLRVRLQHGLGAMSEAGALENGQNQLRIALCGHDTEHNELESMGWTVETWAKSGGYQGADDRERIWFSPAHALDQKRANRLTCSPPARSA